MPHGGKLIIDGKTCVAIEFVLNTMTEVNGHVIRSGMFWGSPQVIILAKHAARLEIDGEAVVVTGADNESIRFRPI